MKKIISGLLAITIIISALAIFPNAAAYPTNYPNTYKNTGDQAADIVSIAKTQIGYESTTGGTKYGAYFGNTYTAWCTFFVSWCAVQAGIPASIINNKNNYTGTMLNDYSAYQIHWYDSGYVPQPGDLFFLAGTQKTKSQSSFEHVGLIANVNPVSKTVTTIEGNCTGKNGGRAVVSHKWTLNKAKTGYDYYGKESGWPQYLVCYVHPNYKTAAYTPMCKISATGTSTSLKLTWTKAKNAVAYRIYGYDISCCQYTGRIAEVTTNSYTVKDLEPSKYYSYLVRAVYANGSLSTYDSVRAKDNIVTCTCPGKVNVKATPGNGKITLEWKSIINAQSYRVYFYDVYKKTYKRLAIINSNEYANNKYETSYYYTGIENQYLVRACNYTGLADYTKADNVAVTAYCKKPAVTTVTSKSAVKLAWSKVPGATYYRVYSYDTSAKKFALLTTTEDTSYFQGGLTPNTKYSYLVRAFNSLGGTFYSSADLINVTTKLEKPTVSAITAVKSVKLTWNKIPGATYYRVYSYNTATKAYKIVANKVTANSYLITNLKSKTDYQFLVRAFSATNNSAYTTADNIILKTK